MNDDKPAIGQRLERTDAPRRGSDLAVTLLSVVAIALPLVFYLHQHVEMLRYGYEIEQLKTQRAALLEQRRELAAERAAATSLPEVERQAARLGLEPVAPALVFAVDGPAGGPAEGPGTPVRATRTARRE